MSHASLGDASYFGRGGMTRDLPRARRLFDRAALAGSPGAMLNAGVMAMTGQGGEEDPAAAARWFEEAAGPKVSSRSLSSLARER